MGRFARLLDAGARLFSPRRSGVGAAPMSEQDAVALISASPLFDAAWYMAEHRDVAKAAIPPALHYVRIGGPALRRPSLYFDPAHYAEQAPEIIEAGHNPLAHYLSIGRSEGKSPIALLDVAPPYRPTEAEVAKPALALDDIEWRRFADLDAARSLVFGGAALGPAEGVSLAPLAACATLRGLDAPTPFETSAYRGLGPRLTALLRDGWFADELTLRLRFDTSSGERCVVRALQSNAPTSNKLDLCGEALLPADGPAFVDLALASPLMPVVLVLAKPEGDIVEIGLLPFPSLFRGGLHYSEIAARGGGANPIAEISRHGDALVRAIAGRRPEAAVRVVVESRGATGAQEIFSKPLVDWLARLFGATVAFGDAAPAGPALILPPDAIPTIAALAHGLRRAPEGEKAAASYLVATASGRRPRWAVTLPPFGDEMAELQPIGTDPLWPSLEGSSTGAEAPLAIRFLPPSTPNFARLIQPLAPDAGPQVLRRAPPDDTRAVIALLACESETSAVRALTSLSEQQSVARLRIRAMVDPKAAAARDAIAAAAETLFPGRSETLVGRFDCASILAAGRDAGDAPLLVARDTIVAPDPRTLEALLTIAAAPGVASAACAVMREPPGKRFGTLDVASVGLFPTHVSLASTPRLGLGAPNCLEALPNATYPVIGNRLDFAVLSPVTAALLAEHDSLDAAPDATFSLAAVAAGMRHICTTGVRVVSVGPAPPAEPLDPPGSASIGVAGWERILSQVTLVRELR